MKVVLDANVLIAAFGFGGICRAVTDVCLDEHELILSEYILAEVDRHLRGKFGHSETEAQERVDLLRDGATVVSPAPVFTNACRDPGDLPVLGTLLSGNAECLVTGDADLLVLRTFQGCAILSPRDFWQRLR